MRDFNQPWSIKLINLINGSESHRRRRTLLLSKESRTLYNISSSSCSMFRTRRSGTSAGWTPCWQRWWRSRYPGSTCPTSTLACGGHASGASPPSHLPLLCFTPLHLLWREAGMLQVPPYPSNYVGMWRACFRYLYFPPLHLLLTCGGHASGTGTSTFLFLSPAPTSLSGRYLTLLLTNLRSLWGSTGTVLIWLEVTGKAGAGTAKSGAALR